SEAERTIKMLQDLLDLARADSGHIRFYYDPVLLNELLPELVAMSAQGLHRNIILDLPEDYITINADVNRLKQILLNLIDNALKYSEPTEDIIIKVETSGDEVMINVCDRGAGIPLQYQSLIFERFYRVDEARSRSTGGCGLGLSIVKTLVEGMGGKITVRSQVGEGSIFTVHLSKFEVKND
ncbi:MAG TPA: HAMP domain-containing sensor histidine kinase, partial [Allocoleopsis sp.]